MITVIIPAYNVEDCLARCINSALSQLPSGLEVLVIDDGSTDNTPRIAESFGDRIRFFRQQNQGQGAARNTGIQVAQGEFLTFLDADDYWRPGFLSTCQQFLAQNPSVGVVSTGFTVVYRDGRQSDFPRLSESDPTGPQVLDNFFRFWADNDHIRTGAVMMRTELVRKVGGQRNDLRISQDLEFWAMLGILSKWGFIPTPLWVGDSRVVGSRAGWTKRYSRRRRMCPTVESWGTRIEPLVPPEAKDDFARIRGRVAAGYMHAKLVSGDISGAKHILDTYSNDMPQSQVKRMVRTLDRFGPAGWWVARYALQCRECLK